MTRLPDRLALEPIGHVRCALRSKAEAARQPAAARGVRGTIELLPGRGFEHALADLPGWEHLWVIFWFHHNRGWRPKVLPPRSRSGRKGVFATRSPHRPNPLGLSVVRLERVEGLVLHVADLDMLDGTPVLDLKPYVAYADSIPAARSGWLEDAAPAGAAPPDPLPAWPVVFEPLAERQAGWIEAQTGLPLRARVLEALALGPEPHPYRRIRRVGTTLHLAFKDWRMRCEVRGPAIHVLGIASGYRPSELARPGKGAPQAHRDYVAQFGGPPRAP